MCYKVNFLKISRGIAFIFGASLPKFVRFIKNLCFRITYISNKLKIGFKIFSVKSIAIVLHRNFSCVLSQCALAIDRHYTEVVPSLQPVKCFRKTKQLFAFWLNERTRIENFPLGFKLFVVQNGNARNVRLEGYRSFRGCLRHYINYAAIVVTVAVLSRTLICIYVHV